MRGQTSLHIPGENRLDDLNRIPSDLRRYIAWSNATRAEYGSIQKFVLKERLGWEDLKSRNPRPYADPGTYTNPPASWPRAGWLTANPEDTKILINDWPYGNAPGILHLVAWTKSSIPTESGNGDLTPEARAIIEEWVHNAFAIPLGKENVLWFKNWASIQSVRSVEHIHVLIRGYSDEFLASVVGKDAVDAINRPIGELEKEKEQKQVCNGN